MNCMSILFMIVVVVKYRDFFFFSHLHFGRKSFLNLWQSHAVNEWMLVSLCRYCIIHLLSWRERAFNVYRDGSVMNRGPGCVIPHPRLPLAAGSSSRKTWTRQITRPCHPRCAIFYFKFFQCLKGLFIVGMGYFFRWREMGSYVQPIYMGDISISELYGPIVTRQIPCQW